MKELRLSVVVAVGLITVLFLSVAETSWAQVSGQGALKVVEPDGKPGVGCPLEHTSVKAEVSGFVSRVSVIQTLYNPRQEKIEATYFDLSQGDSTQFWPTNRCDGSNRRLRGETARSNSFAGVLAA